MPALHRLHRVATRQELPYAASGSPSLCCTESGVQMFAQEGGMYSSYHRQGAYYWQENILHLSVRTNKNTVYSFVVRLLVVYPNPFSTPSW